MTTAPQRPGSCSSPHISSTWSPTPQLVTQNHHPGLGAFEVEPDGVTGAASWAAFCRRGLCPSSPPSSLADACNNHQRSRPPRVTEPRRPRGCLLNKRPLRALPGHHTAGRRGQQGSRPARRRRAGRSCRGSIPRPVPFRISARSVVVSGTAWGLIGHLTAAGGGPGEREQLAGALPAAAASPDYSRRAGRRAARSGRYLHFKGAGPGFLTLGT